MKVWRAWMAAEFRRAAWAMPWLIGAHLLSVGTYTRWAWDLSDRMRWLIGLAQMGLSLWVVVTSLWEGAPLRRKRFLATRPHSLRVLVLSKGPGLWVIAVLPFILGETVVGLYHDMPWRTVMLGSAQAFLLGTAGLAAAFPALWWWKRWPEAVVGLVLGLPLALTGAALAYGKWWFPGVPLWPVAVLGSCGLFALAGWIGLGMGRFGWWARIGLFPPFVWLCLIGGLELGFRPPPMDETVEVRLARVEGEAGSRYDFYQKDQPVKLLRISVPSDPVGDSVERRWSELGRYYTYDDWHGEGAGAAMNCVLHRHLGRKAAIYTTSDYQTDTPIRHRLPLGIRLPRMDGETLSVKPDVTAVETQLVWEVVADLPVGPGTSVAIPGETWSIHDAPALGTIARFTVRHARGLAWLGDAGDHWVFPSQKECYFLYDSRYSELRRATPNPGRRGWSSGPWASSVLLETLEFLCYLDNPSLVRNGISFDADGNDMRFAEQSDSRRNDDFHLLIVRPRTVKRIAHSWRSPESVGMVVSASVPYVQSNQRELEAAGMEWLDANPPPVSWCSDKVAAQWLEGFFGALGATEQGSSAEAAEQWRRGVFGVWTATAKNWFSELRKAEQAVGRLAAEHPEVGLRILAKFKQEFRFRKQLKEHLAPCLTREVVMAVPESHTDPFVAWIALHKGFFREIAPAIAKRVRGGAWSDLTDIIERVPAKIGLTEAEWLDYFRMRPLGSVYRALCGTVVPKKTLDAEVERILRNWTDSRGIDDPLELPDLALAVGRPEAPAWVAARLNDPDDDLRLNPALVPMISRYFDPPVKRDMIGYQDVIKVRSWFLSCDPSGFGFNAKRGKYEFLTPE